MIGVKRGVLFLVLGLVLFALYYLLLRGGSEMDYDTISPEELNSLIQNKDEVRLLQKTELLLQSLTTPYLKQPDSLKVTNWEVHGNAMVKNNDYIRLTRDAKHQASNMFASAPIDAESFEMEFTFRITTPGVTRGLMGDGLAIWLLDSKSEIGDVFGVNNYFNGLGIMLDTYKNGKRGNFPYVNLMLGDGHTKYSKGDDGYATRLAGCPLKKLVNPATGETKMRLVYLKNGYLSIDFNLNGIHEEWTNCVALTDVQLPQVKYLGFSAETGELTQQSDVIENRIYGLLKPDGTYINSLAELEGLAEKKQETEEHLKAPLNRDKKGYGRKSMARLRRAEERIKERDRRRRLEKYGDSDATFVVRNVRRVVTFFKYLLYLVIVVLALWAMFIVYRMRKLNKKSRVVGLLD